MITTKFKGTIFGGMMSKKKTARYRAKLKAKKSKERLRKKGLLKVRKNGGRIKRVKRKTKSL